jgi:hypothetical protein
MVGIFLVMRSSHNLLTIKCKHVLTRLSGPERNEVGNIGYCIMWKVSISVIYIVLSSEQNRGGYGGLGIHNKTSNYGIVVGNCFERGS